MNPINLRKVMGSADQFGTDNSMLSGVSTGVNTIPAINSGNRRHAEADYPS
jgi:hypothetical protein